MESETLTQTRKMRHSFAVSIRRQKNEEIFKMMRSRQKENLLQQEQTRMVACLDTAEAREEWILRISRDLSGIPSPDWGRVIFELLKSLLCFKGSGSYKIWVQLGIVRSICELFKEQFADLGLASEAAKLLSSAMFYEQQSSETKTSLIADEILKDDDTIRSLMNLADDRSLSHSETSHLFAMIGNLTLNNPSILIRAGAITVGVDWSLRMLRDKKLNRAYLDQIYQYFLCMAQNISKISTNYNFSDQVLKLMDEFIQIDQSAELLRKILLILLNIIKLQKESVYRNFLNRTCLVKQLFILSNHQQQSIRMACWSILAYLSMAETAQDVFLEYNFHNLMDEAYKKEPVENGSFDKITHYMITILSNLAAEGDQMKDHILCNPIIGMIFDSLHEQRPISLRKIAYYCICNLVLTQNYNLIQRMVKEMNFLQKMILGLESMMNKNKGTVLQILQALQHLITVDFRLYRYNQDGILEILNGNPRFCKLLNQLEDKFYGCHEIRNACENIIDKFSYTN